MQCQSVNSFGGATSIYNGIFYLHVLYNTSVRTPQNYNTLQYSEKCYLVSTHLKGQVGPPVSDVAFFAPKEVS